MTCTQHQAELASCIAEGDGGKLLAADQSAASISWLLDVESLDAEMVGPMCLPAMLCSGNGTNCQIAHYTDL